HFERTSGGTHGGVGDVKVAGRGFQVGVTQQGLNDNEVGPVVQQMRGKGVANADALVWQYGPAAPPSCIFQKRFHARGGVPSFHLGRATLQAASSASKRPVLRVVGRRA